MRWLALDIGARRVGVAASDTDEKVVTPLAPLAYRGPLRLAEDARALIDRLGAGGVVVGVPRTRGGRGRGERRVADVVAALRAIVSVPVELEDERGTTAAAESLLAEAGVPPRRWEALVDGLAARLILEGHLAARERGRPGGIDLPDLGC